MTGRKIAAALLACAAALAMVPIRAAAQYREGDIKHLCTCYGICRQGKKPYDALPMTGNGEGLTRARASALATIDFAKKCYAFGGVLDPYTYKEICMTVPP